MISEMDAEDVRNISSTRLVELEKHSSGSCGFHLTRSKWDPYPWVSRVDPQSPAQVAGMLSGECVLEINGEDLVGKRISEIADRVRSGSNLISLLLWNSGTEPQCNSESLCCGPMPQNLQRLSACMSSILSVLDCPVCLDTTPPPVYQCENGHLMCLRCRAKSERCPVCRMRLTRGRCLLAEQVYNTITDVFNLREDSEQSRKEKMQTIFKLGTRNKDIPNIKVTQSHTNKLLARLIGKSTSVDNLSNNGSLKSHMQIPPASLEHNFGTNLKAKSLSTSEICKSLSPASSRNGSLLQLNGNFKPSRQTSTNLTRGLENGSVSCHGSFESLNKKQKSETTSLISNVYLSSPSHDDAIYQCPYNADCFAKIKGTDVIKHFQLSHSGPIIQYFQSKLRLSFIQVQHDSCYVIHIEELTFFLKVLDVTDNEICKTEKAPSMQLWIWLLADVNTCNKYQYHTKILNSEEKLLLGVTSAVLSLEKVSWKSIIENRRGVYINFETLQLLSPSNPNIFLDIEIQKI